MDDEEKLKVKACQIADLIQIHNDLIEDDRKICESIECSRKTTEFFLSIDDVSRARYEAEHCFKMVMNFLGLVD